ncbi:M61 family metallopeptidase [Hymenobacter guriensis]|uniref:Peptidase M61 n=1 Tax=Hymenobacter guriensis TaxID=2793065 RepID=A0ABS0L2Y5_9BACT|nr:peptidase M61 [Hymenobacter guriensis]MBG8554515.1 peptidase M61 [Hymenobacter guriensis]
MKPAYLLLGLLPCATATLAQNSPATYRVAVDLQQVQNDRVRVVVRPPVVRENQATYVLPSVVPGSYSKKDYGRFITDFQAFDSQGKKLKTTRQGDNLFLIDKARQLDRLEYLVDDTWDSKDKNFVFQPGGTNIDAGRNFVLNHYGLYGYLEGYKMQPYEVTINKPADLYGATSLGKQSPTATQDVFRAGSYVQLADAPVMYSRPDTTSFTTGGARISVSVFSENGVVKSAQVSEAMRPMAEALARFFGRMPVPRYHFIMYFPAFSSPVVNPAGGFGAMEHSYSSVYFLPEIADAVRIRSLVREVASHEFLHILTPLNIHSREIGEFDFRTPKMSQHLWLYEGVTEYFAQLVQLQGGLTQEDEFRKEIKHKIEDMQKYRTVSFTDMSRNILVDPYKDMYENVYKKGALIGFLLDIRIQELTQGRLSLRDVLLQLGQKYGPERPFEDEQLIPEIVQLTHPQLQQFFTEYVQGSQPLPLSEYLAKVGWRYAPKANVVVKAFGELGFRYDQDKQSFILAQTRAENNVFGLQNDDVILQVNSTPVTMENAEQLLRPLIEPATDTPVRIVYRRGSTQQQVEASPRDMEAEVKHLLEPLPTLTEAQRALHDQLLRPRA